MSFVDLATLAIHRRHEMETKIKAFHDKCDLTIDNIKKLKEQAQYTIHQLNCDPAELKERYLKGIYQLEDYTYLITDIELALVGKLGETSGPEYSPFNYMSAKCLTPVVSHQPLNIMDVLSEPSNSYSNRCPAKEPKKQKKKVPTEEHSLIVFSSASCSNESMQIKNELSNIAAKKISDKNNELSIKIENESQNELCEAAIDSKISDSGYIAACPENLPPQTILNQDSTYAATIISVDGTSFWVIASDVSELRNRMSSTKSDYPRSALQLVTEMTDHYNSMKDTDPLSPEEVLALTYCACYDIETEHWYRGLFLQYIEDSDSVEVFLVDTGETRVGPIGIVRPLAASFFAAPPFARCCHLAGVEMLKSIDPGVIVKQEQFLRQYISTPCTIRIEDNTSESLGVSVKLSTGMCLEDILVEAGLAYRIDEFDQKSSGRTPPPRQPSHGPPEARAFTDSELEMLDMDDPEYEDPLEAVTGYCSRDEADICKHYKGGPEKTCFKGARCTKKHIQHNPDGWTHDKIAVVAKCPVLQLPAPDTWLRVRVTCVIHFDRLYVQFLSDYEEERDQPRFGVMRPPTSLRMLTREMNSPAQRMEYKPLTIAPAAGELVAAMYPFDNQYYRARVLMDTPADHCVQVFYIDYGNTVAVREDKLSALSERFAMLPEQAVRCRLAGVEANDCLNSGQWAKATKALTKLVLEQTLDAHVIAREYDEITLELYDKKGVSIAEELAAKGLVKLVPFEVIDDTKVLHKLVIP